MKSTKPKIKQMKIAVGSDHGGFDLKEGVVTFLKGWGYHVTDFGTRNSERCDYPAIGYRVASGVAGGKFERGVLICKSGIGMCIVANKVPGVRAALLTDLQSACLSRQHNDANIAIFSGKSMTVFRAKKILEAWLSAAFEGGRHLKRVKMIKNIEDRIKRTSK